MNDAHAPFERRLLLHIFLFQLQVVLLQAEVLVLEIRPTARHGDRQGPPKPLRNDAKQTGALEHARRDTRPGSPNGQLQLPDAA